MTGRGGWIRLGVWLGWVLLVVGVSQSARADFRRPGQGKSTSRRQIEPRRGGSNFFVVNVCDLNSGCSPSGQSETGLVKFRVDLEYDIAWLESWRNTGYFYLTFPIRFLSFWDVFNVLPESRSSAFIETNYAPGLEVSWVNSSGAFLLRSGILHESNGIGVVPSTGVDQLALSRSWNRLYGSVALDLLPDVSDVGLVLEGTGWLPFVSIPVEEWPNGRDPGTKLEDHVGYWQVGIAGAVSYGPWAHYRVRSWVRYPHAVEGELRWSLHGGRSLARSAEEHSGFLLDVLLHCYIGKGERLIVANEVQHSCYLGLGL